MLAFACALVFAATLLAGLLPAISSTGKGAIAALQASSRSAAGNQSRTALRKTLLTVEIATTVVLLIAAGLLLKSFWRLRTTDVGCATDNVLTMGYSLPAKKYDSPEKVNAFNEALLERVRAMPGVRAAGLGSIVPGAGAGERRCLHDSRASTDRARRGAARRALLGWPIPDTSAHCRYRC